MANTSVRLLSMLSLFTTGRVWPAALLAERLGVGDRTVRRDVDRLRQLGYPIVATMGPDGGYRLEAGSELPPLLFDDDQAVALAVALRTVSVGNPAIEEAAARALSSVRQLMPPRLRRRIDLADVSVAGPTAAPAAVDVDVLEQLGAAIQRAEVLRFDHHRPGAGPAENPSRRTVEPHHLVTRTGNWYLVAFDLDRDDWRTFRVDRLVPSPNTGPRFERRDPPGGDVAAFVARRLDGQRPDGRWPCIGRVVLELPAEAVVPFVGDAAVERLDAHRCQVELGSWSWPGLAAHVVMFDADVEVLGPQELVDACADVARRFAILGR